MNFQLLIFLLWISCQQDPSLNLRTYSSSHIYYQDIFMNISGIRKEFNGAKNNLQHPNWGSSHRPLKRVAPSAYSDYRKSPSG